MDKKEIEIAVKTLDEHKAEDITILDIDGLSPFASTAIVATCRNPRSLNAMRDLLDEAYEKESIKLTNKDGEPDSGWIVISVPDTIIHLMLEGNRRQLQLEDLLKSRGAKVGQAQ